METFSSEPLATESFSYSWLVKQTPQFDGLEDYLTSTSSPRDTNFNFDTSISRSSSFNFVHADEIFSNGHIIPFYLDRTKSHVEAFDTLSSDPIPISKSDRMKFYYFLKNLRASSRRVIRGWWRMWRPLCHKVGCSRKSIRVDDIDRKKWEIRSLENLNISVEASPRQSMSKKSEYRRLKKARSWSSKAQESVPTSPYCFDNESSIYEAVLHCKRSIEN